MLKRIFFTFALITNFVLANIYSSGIKISDDTVSQYKNANNTWSGDFTKTKLKIWFILNESGSNQAFVKVFIMDGDDTIATITKNQLNAGENFVVWDGKDKNGKYVATKSYKFIILAKDPVGHNVVDSLWVTGANRNGQLDFDGLTTFPYRGTAAYHNQDIPQFGNILVARGTNSGVNGAWRLRADGEYLDKIIQVPYQTSLTNRYFELGILNNNVFLFPGHSYSSIGRNYQPDGTLKDTFNFKYKNARGFSVMVDGADTNIIFGCMENARFGLLKFKYRGTDTALFIDMRPLNPSGGGYIIATAIDDENNIYVAYAKTSEARKRLAKYDKNGNLIWNKALDTDWGLAASGLTYPLFSSLALYSGKNKNSASDDKLYAYIFGATGESGIYEINLDGSSITKLITPSGFSNSTQAQKLGVDPAGNIIYSNGSAQERIILLTPADGPNEFITQNPVGTDIIVTKVPVQVDFLINEPFNYPAGDKLTDHGYIAHSAAGQGPILVADTNLIYPGNILPTSGNAIKTISPTGKEDVRKFFVDNKTVNSGKLYVSFLFNVETFADGLADYNFHLSDNTNNSTTFKGRFFVKKDATTKKLSFAISESQKSDNVNFTNAVYDTATTYLALMMIDLDKPYKPNYLWINPDLSEHPDTNLADSKILATSNYNWNYGSICFRQGSAQGTVLFDEIKVGTDFELFKVEKDTTTPPPADIVLDELNENFDGLITQDLPQYWNGEKVKVFLDNYGNNNSKGYAGWDMVNKTTHWIATPRVKNPKFVSFYIAGFSNSDEFKVYFQKSSDKTNWINIDSTFAPPLGFQFTNKVYNLTGDDTLSTLYFRWYCPDPVKNGFFIDDVVIGEPPVSNEKPKVNLTYNLQQNYPNPFNPTTVIRFSIPKEVKVELKVYNILGQEVATLVNNVLKAGHYNVDFNASNLSSGVYICRINTKDYTKTIKMLLIK